jgi:hypothetical protein
MQILKTQIIKGMRFEQTSPVLPGSKYEFGSDKFLTWEDKDTTPIGSMITVSEKCKGYQGSGQMIRYSIDGLPGEFLSFWSDFNKNVQYIETDDVVVPTKPTKPTGDKGWTPLQKNRMGDRGYYLTYAGDRCDEPQTFGVVYIGDGKCLYIDQMSRMGWVTLLWTSAPTKKKIAEDKNNPIGNIPRYIYFETHG